MARIPAAIYSFAASFLAQYRMVEEESLVRSRIAPVLAQTRARGFGRFLATLVIVATGLGACAPRLAELGTQPRAPAIETFAGEPRFITRDGLRLGLTEWDAAEPRAVVVALHGMADYAHAFALPAAWLAERGVTTYAYDQRGFGRSPSRGLWAGEEILRQDVNDFVDVVRQRHPNVPVIVMGESMGGAVAMTAFASSNPPRADGLILIAPAVWGRDTMPFSYRTALWVTAHSFPYWELSGSGLNMWPSDNVPVLREMARDPLMIKQTRTDAIYGLVNLMDHAYSAAASLWPVPTLLAYGDKDQIIPKAATKGVEKSLRTKSSRVAIKEYAYGYHLLLRDLQGPRVWTDLLSWIDGVVTPSADAVAAPSPSGAVGAGG